jgi:hypothetical protein
VEAALLIIGVALALMALAPVAPSRTRRHGLRARIARQRYLWDRYLLNPPGGEPWHE